MRSEVFQLPNAASFHQATWPEAVPRSWVREPRASAVSSRGQWAKKFSLLRVYALASSPPLNHEVATASGCFSGPGRNKDKLKKVMAMATLKLIKHLHHRHSQMEKAGVLCLPKRKVQRETYTWRFTREYRQPLGKGWQTRAISGEDQNKQAWLEAKGSQGRDWNQGPDSQASGTEQFG